MFVKSCYNSGIVGNSCGPIIEPVQTNYIEKEYIVNVPHVMPVHTHTVNKVIYNHTYSPEYSCSESTEVINNECGNTCNLM